MSGMMDIVAMFGPAQKPKRRGRGIRLSDYHMDDADFDAMETAAEIWAGYTKAAQKCWVGWKREALLEHRDELLWQLHEGERLAPYEKQHPPASVISAARYQRDYPPPGVFAWA